MWRRVAGVSPTPFPAHVRTFPRRLGIHARAQAREVRVRRQQLPHAAPVGGRKRGLRACGSSRSGYEKRGIQNTGTEWGHMDTRVPRLQTPVRALQRTTDAHAYQGGESDARCGATRPLLPPHTPLSHTAYTAHTNKRTKSKQTNTQTCERTNTTNQNEAAEQTNDRAPARPRLNLPWRCAG